MRELHSVLHDHDATRDDLQNVDAASTFREDEEFAALAPTPGQVNASYSSKRNGGYFNGSDDYHYLKTIAILVCGCMTLAVAMLLFYRKEVPIISDPLPHYSCPVMIKDSDQNPHFEEHVQDDVDIVSNLTIFVESFRTQPFDRWENTYTEFKAGIYQWKVERFAPYLENGSTIYESAAGIGLNLLLTLEVLQQVKGLDNLVVYGNDYIQESVSIGLEVLDNQGLLRPTNGHVGKFCRADSIDLHSFVPANAFDLVFTGYLTPLYDPLQLNMSDWDLDAYYSQLCHLKPSVNSTSAGDTTLSTEQKDIIDQEHQLFLLQRRQEDWFGAWVSEMIRIAKPGAPIIIEQIARPTCQAPEDWGGVSPEFWKQAVKRYDWNVDMESIESEDELLSKGKRYHVFMIKNKNGIN